MRTRAVLVLATLVPGVLAAAGCRFGNASFSGNVGDRTFDPTGTVFSYVDARDEALTEDPERDPPVAVAMTWLVFDPGSDLADLDGSALAAYEHEVRLRDALGLVFSAQSEVEPGASFESIKEGTEEQGNGRMTAFVHLAPERLTPQSTYAGFVPFAGRREVRVELDQADFQSARLLSGTISVSFERTDSDPGQVREGQITGTFVAPLVEERVAERNLALLDVVDVMGLPITQPGEALP